MKKSYGIGICIIIRGAVFFFHRDKPTAKMRRGKQVAKVNRACVRVRVRVRVIHQGLITACTSSAVDFQLFRA